MHDRRKIRARRGEGGTVRGIARDVGASRNAVRRALDPGARLEYRRPTLADEFAPAVHDILADHPRIGVPQIAVLVDWPGARSTLSALVAKIRPCVVDRERENLNRPAVGAMITGRIAAGAMTIGRMTVGRMHHDDSSSLSVRNLDDPT